MDYSRIQGRYVLIQNDLVRLDTMKSDWPWSQVASITIMLTNPEQDDVLYRRL